MPDQVAEPAAEDHQRGEGEDVRRQQPLAEVEAGVRPWITSGVASGTAVWSTRIMLLASVIATSVIHIDRLLICIA